MGDFFQKQTYTQADIESIIIRKQEESSKLEFKSGEALNKSKPDKIQISKAISAFANSGGGILIYGILEKNHVAENTSFVDGDEVKKEWLEQVINSNVQPAVEGILIFPIRFDSDFKKSVYLIKIPPSDNGHMAADQKYYKRSNFMSIPMEHYEVRDLYHKSKKAVLSIIDLVHQKRSSFGVPGNYGKFRFQINFIVRNDSDYKEDNYKMVFEIPTILIYDPNTKLENCRVLTEGNVNIYSVPSESPLFKKDKTSLCPLKGTLPFNFFEAIPHSSIL